jgi:TolB protein
VISLASFVCVTSLGVSSGGDPSSELAYLQLTDGVWQVWTVRADGTAARPVTSSRYDKTRASWYPRGDTLLVNASDGNAYRVAARTGQEILVKTSLTGFQDAVVSPDGATFVFSLSTSGSVDDHHIWLAHADGSNLTKLTSMPWLQHEPSWSADGRYVYFLSGKGEQTHDIWRVEVASRRTEQITANDLYHFDVAIAPDGSLAYSSNRTGRYEIWIQQLGEQARQLTHDETLDARPTWSPDGRSLAFESTSSGRSAIWKVDADGSHRQRLTPPSVSARFPVWGNPGAAK